MNRHAYDDDFHHDPNAMINNMGIDHYLGLLIRHYEGAPIICLFLLFAIAANRNRDTRKWKKINKTKKK